MLNFWDHLWLAKYAMVEDYYREKREREKKWENFCQECTKEILDASKNIVGIIQETTGKQPGSHIDKALVDGLVYLPLYAFYLVLGGQGKLSKEQSSLLNLYFSHFNIKFTVARFLEAVEKDSYVRDDLLKLVGISEDMAGEFWVQFFKVLYRTDEDTTHISRIIDQSCTIMMRFAAISGKNMDYLMNIMKIYIESIHIQAVLCRTMPNDEVDFYGDETFLEHFNKYKRDVKVVCEYTMGRDDELNPRDFFSSFTVGLIYQVISRCTGSRGDKESITNDVMSQIDIEVGESVDGKYIYKYMEDLQGEDTSMLAVMAHMFTDVDKPMGWIILARGSGTYNLETKNDIRAVQEAINFIIGMENYLTDKYPMSGFGHIASDYAKEVVEIINNDIDENVEIVDESTLM